MYLRYQKAGRNQGLMQRGAKGFTGNQTNESDCSKLFNMTEQWRRPSKSITKVVSQKDRRPPLPAELLDLTDKNRLSRPWYHILPNIVISSPKSHVPIIFASPYLLNLISYFQPQRRSSYLGIAVVAPSHTPELESSTRHHQTESLTTLFSLMPCSLNTAFLSCSFFALRF